MKISEVKELLNQDGISEEILSELKKDERSGVQKLLISYAKKQEKKLFYKKEYEKKSFYENKCYNNGCKYICGIDEVGRGPLAGPVVAAAVILKQDSYFEGLNDSKKLSEHKREELSEIIKEKALSYSISMCDSKEIDEKGIGYCNNDVFIKACEGLSIKPDLVLSDGYLIKNFNGENKHVIKGDTKSACIACASIIAKVYRDNIMKKYHKKYPQYDFEKNVGYGTKTHVDALKEVGPTEIHRMSFLKNIL